MIRNGIFALTLAYVALVLDIYVTGDLVGALTLAGVVWLVLEIRLDRHDDNDDRAFGVAKSPPT